MRKLLVLLAIAWVGVSLAAAWVSVDEQVPYDLSFLAAQGAADQVGVDWLRGWGTGLAAPLAGVAAVAVMAVLSTMDRSAGRLGTFLLAVLGGLSVAYTLSNQVTYDRLRDNGADPAQAALVGATLALAGLMVLVGITAWLTAPRGRYA